MQKHCRNNKNPSQKTNPIEFDILSSNSQKLLFIPIVTIHYNVGDQLSVKELKDETGSSFVLLKPNLKPSWCLKIGIEKSEGEAMLNQIIVCVVTN